MDLGPPSRPAGSRAIRTIFVSEAVNFLAAVVLFILAVGNVRASRSRSGLTTIVDVIIVILFTHPVLQLLARTKFFGEGHQLSGLDPRALGAVYRGRAQFRAVRSGRRPRKGGLAPAVKPRSARPSPSARRPSCVGAEHREPVDRREGLLMASFDQFGNDLTPASARSTSSDAASSGTSIAAVMIADRARRPVPARRIQSSASSSPAAREFIVSDVATPGPGRRPPRPSPSVVPEAVPKVTTVGSNSIRVQTDQLTSDREPRGRARPRRRPTTCRPAEVTSSFIGPSLGRGRHRPGPAGPGDLPGARRRRDGPVLPHLEDVGRRDDRPAPRPRHHGRRLRLTGFEITPAAVIGFLTILGYSLYDTVVVFDKIRENTAEDGRESGAPSASRSTSP